MDLRPRPSFWQQTWAGLHLCCMHAMPCIKQVDCRSCSSSSSSGNGQACQVHRGLTEELCEGCLSC